MRRVRVRSVRLGLIFAVAVASCGGRRPLPGRTVTVACDRSVWLPGGRQQSGVPDPRRSGYPPDDFAVIGGLAFAGLAPGAFSPAVGVAKVRVTVMGHQAVRLSVAQGSLRDASLLYDRDNHRPLPYRVPDGEATVTFRPCPTAEFTAFAGGFILPGPRCVTVRVEMPGRARSMTRRLAVGVSANRC